MHKLFTIKMRCYIRYASENPRQTRTEFIRR